MDEKWGETGMSGAILGLDLFNKEPLFHSNGPLIKTMVEVWSQSWESERWKVLKNVKQADVLTIDGGSKLQFYVKYIHCMEKNET